VALENDESLNELAKRFIIKFKGNIFRDGPVLKPAQVTPGRTPPGAQVAPQQCLILPAGKSQL